VCCGRHGRGLSSHPGLTISDAGRPALLWRQSTCLQPGPARSSLPPDRTGSLGQPTSASRKPRSPARAPGRSCSACSTSRLTAAGLHRHARRAQLRQAHRPFGSLTPARLAAAALAENRPFGNGLGHGVDRGDQAVRGPVGDEAPLQDGTALARGHRLAFEPRLAKAELEVEWKLSGRPEKCHARDSEARGPKLPSVVFAVAFMFRLCKWASSLVGQILGTTSPCRRGEIARRSLRGRGRLASWHEGCLRSTREKVLWQPGCRSTKSGRRTAKELRRASHLTVPLASLVGVR
jgi:hypothetical protein